MSYPLTEKDVPVEAIGNIVICAVCGHRGYKDSTDMMRISTRTNDWGPIWVHTDICWNKWHLNRSDKIIQEQLEEEE